MQLKASAPGSLILLGEYAVLHGKHALVCAVNKYITVTLTPSLDKRIEIESSLHGRYETDLTSISIEKPFHFVLGALQHYQPKLKTGCHIAIESEFSDKVGLGSSAAVTVATLAALVTWLNIRVSPLDLVRQGRNVVRHVQGVGSGADIAASVYGGLVGYQPQPLLVEKFAATYPLSALYAGFKTPTVEAIKRVQQQFSAHPDLFRHISNSIGQCAFSGMHAARKAEWSKLGEIMNIQQGMMEALGVSLPILRDMVEELRKQPGMLGAKISGSGLGDCVVGLGGPLPDQYVYKGEHTGIQPVSAQMSQQGVRCEKI
ncbi:mevalonate kinase [Aquicella lusitana]|uniref:Mevalonate kinase n=1 Tax=Aquicella lusitana TaxID=254246 RepID=A0A370GNT8_9COXI|nr:mevalonate kinase [Aquicella lusitana]RDI45181.1 mevalonate kinase [Aquicella lusitana]VVC72749.1 Galactokinase [Aquicella lusitana]